jgi:hypothetical protein
MEEPEIVRRICYAAGEVAREEQDRKTLHLPGGYVCANGRTVGLGLVGNGNEKREKKKRLLCETKYRQVKIFGFLTLDIRQPATSSNLLGSSLTEREGYEDRPI